MDGLFKVAVSSLLLSASFSSASLAQDRGYFLQGVLSERCIITEMDEPSLPRGPSIPVVDSGGEVGLLPGVVASIAGSVLPIFIKAGLNTAISEILPTLEAQKRISTATLQSSFFAVHEKSEDNLTKLQLGRNNNLRCLTLVGSNRFKYPLQGEDARPHFELDGKVDRGLDRNNRLLASGFNWNDSKKKSPPFVAEIQFVLSDDGTHAFAKAVHLDINDWGWSSGSRRGDWNGVLLTVDLKGSSTASFHFELGKIFIDESNSNSMKLLVSDGYSIAVGESMEAKELDYLGIRTAWTALPSLSKEMRSRFIAEARGRKASSKTTYGPVTVVASLVTTNEPGKLRKALAKALRSAMEDGGAVDQLSSTASDAIIPPTAEDKKEDRSKKIAELTAIVDAAKALSLVRDAEIKLLESKEGASESDLKKAQDAASMALMAYNEAVVDKSCYISEDELPGCK